MKISLEKLCALLAVMIVGCRGDAHASPPIDNSPSVFLGEWSGVGPHGSFCFMRLGENGHGTVMVDVGSGDWMGANIDWQNQRQSLAILKITPWPTDAGQRTGPLVDFRVKSGFNNALQLQWTQDIRSGCHLMRDAEVRRHLDQIRLRLKDTHEAPR